METRTIDTRSAELRSFLFDLARLQDELAAKEAAGVPYWSPTPRPCLALARQQQHCAPRPTTFPPRTNPRRHGYGLVA